MWQWYVTVEVGCEATSTWGMSYLKWLGCQLKCQADVKPKPKFCETIIRGMGYRNKPQTVTCVSFHNTLMQFAMLTYYAVAATYNLALKLYFLHDSRMEKFDKMSAVLFGPSGYLRLSFLV